MYDIFNLFYFIYFVQTYTNIHIIIISAKLIL